MAGEPSQNQRKETEGGDLRVVSCLCGKGGSGSTETDQ